MIEIGIGILSGLIASTTFLLILRKLRPMINISPQISCSLEDGKKEYAIKIINKNKRNIVDLRVELLLVQSSNVPGGFILNTNSIALKTDHAFIVSKFDSADKDAEYARRFVCYENLDTLWQNEDIDYVIFRVYCHDEVSGFGKVFTQEYRTKRTCLIDGQFHFGDDLEIS